MDTQSIYIFLCYVGIVALTVFTKAKESCTCHIKVPAATVSFISLIVIGFLNGFNPTTYLIGLFLLLNIVGSILFAKIGKISGGFSYIASFIVFILASNFSFKLIDINEFLIFSVLLGIFASDMRTDSTVSINVYIISLFALLLVGVTSYKLYFMVGTSLIVLSEMMLIIINRYKGCDKLVIDSSYLSASLYAYGIILVPLALL